MKCGPGPEGGARTPPVSQEPLGSPVPGPETGVQGDPHKGAEGNPGGPQEEARRIAGRAQPSALHSRRPLSGQRIGSKLKKPWVSPKVSSESIFLVTGFSVAVCVSLPLARNDRRLAHRAPSSAVYPPRAPSARCWPKLGYVPRCPPPAPESLCFAGCGELLPPCSRLAQCSRALRPRSAPAPRARTME